MRRLGTLILLSLLSSLGGCGGSQIAARSAPPTLVIVSMDGFRHDYHTRVDTPNFDRMAREGAHADRLIPPFPSQTFAAHATLATGVTAGRHGIMNNRFLDRERGPFNYNDEADWYDSPPLWVHAERNGRPAKIYHWIGSRGAYEGVEPTASIPFDKAITDDQKLVQIIAWLNAPDAPRLIMSYWGGCDHVGHETGPDSAATTACIRATDVRLGRLMAGITKAPGPVTLIVVSDHGMTRTIGEIDLEGLIKGAGVTAKLAASGPIAHLFIEDEGQRALAFELLSKTAHLKVYTRQSLPKAWAYNHPTRTGDLVVKAAFGWHFSSDPKTLLPGHHGHDPNHPDMGAIFYAWGPQVRAGLRFETVQAVDLFPTACALLGIPIPVGLDGEAVDLKPSLGR